MIRPINHSRKDHFLLVNGITSRNKYQDLFDFDEVTSQKSMFFKHEISLKQKYFFIYKNQKSQQLNIQTKKQLKSQTAYKVPINDNMICGGKSGLKDNIFHIKLFQPDTLFQNIIQTSETIQSHSKQFGQHYIVVRSLKNQQKQAKGYRIKKNNIIKLGASQFFVHSISVKEQQGNGKKFFFKKNMFEEDEVEVEEEGSIMVMNDQKFFIKNNKIVYDASNQKNQNPQSECKYCMMPQSSQQGQFLCSPCKCSGSCRLVHFNCLVKWNENKVKKTQNKGCIQYNFQKFFCQVCKSEYPQYIKKNQTMYELMPIQRPNGQYIVLQSINSIKRNIIILEDMKQQGIVIGRGHECEFKIQEDSTVSRRHAIIKKVKGDFVIYDLKSKFGTLVRENSSTFSLKKDEKISIQSGNSIISFSLIKKSSQNMFQC